MSTRSASKTKCNVSSLTSPSNPPKPLYILPMCGASTSGLANGMNSAIARQAPMRNGAANPGARDCTDADKIVPAMLAGTPLDTRAATHSARPRKNGADCAVLSCKSTSITVCKNAERSNGTGKPFCCARSALVVMASLIVPTASNVASRIRHHFSSPAFLAAMDSDIRLFATSASAVTALGPNCKHKESSIKPQDARNVEKSSSSSATY
mmetsp:Transcript_9209/g.30410  ORF Transcript_9209/g.30410 Transcript_9209/m.30410 type:complete len:210 (-) Transcript_9209:1225-1854(-)